MDIIDTHVFYGQNEPLELNHKLDKFIKAQQKYQGHHNVRFIVIPASPETNENLADLVKDNPNLFLGAYLGVVPRADLQWRYTSPEELYDFCERNEIKGLKTVSYLTETPINSRLLNPYIELAKDKNIPFLFHCGATGTDYTSYEKNRDLVKTHHDLKVILAHFGGLNPDFIKGSLSLVREFPNVYLNTTGMSGEIKRYEKRADGKFYVKEWYTDLELRKKWAEVLKKTMQDSDVSSKILFGTDYPELSHDIYPLDQLLQQEQEKIMNNAIELFKLVL